MDWDPGPWAVTGGLICGVGTDETGLGAVVVVDVDEGWVASDPLAPLEPLAHAADSRATTATARLRRPRLRDIRDSAGPHRVDDLVGEATEVVQLGVEGLG